MKFGKSRNLGGVTVYNVDEDDFRGHCGQKYPLASQAKIFFNVYPPEFNFHILVKNYCVL